jgi:N-acetylglucosaminyldiphosphoundecaprenol N-acetyl-beta-D-mannosaminyltransferase
MPRLFQHSVPRGYRHYLYGGSEQALALLQHRLRKLAPGVEIVGAHSPPYRALTAEEDDAAIAAVNHARPDIVWVGLSTPKQERWMASHRARIEAPVLIGVGAAFDIHAGLVPRAPRMLRRTGFEWTYRLMKEPRRLWRRYLSSNPRFVALVTMQQLGLFKPSL